MQKGSWRHFSDNQGVPNKHLTLYFTISTALHILFSFLFCFLCHLYFPQISWSDKITYSWKSFRAYNNLGGDHFQDLAHRSFWYPWGPFWYWKPHWIVFGYTVCEEMQLSVACQNECSNVCFYNWNKQIYQLYKSFLTQFVNMIFFLPKIHIAI